ncbi:unnamed protein product [Cunninghamella blakesleeana]
MGVYVQYKINNLTIKKEFTEKALSSINDLHSKKNLETLARGCMIPSPASIDSDEEARKYLWYSFVKNPVDPNGFSTLQEAFKNWELVNIYSNHGEEDLELIEKSFRWNQNGDFIINGEFDNKLGQPDVLLRAIAPYCEDINISIKDDYGDYVWMIKNGEFKEIN